jgi:CAAX prenyl protease-like protein
MPEQEERRAARPAVAPLPHHAPFLQRAAWARILPFATYLVCMVARDLLQRFGVDAADLRWLYAFQVGAVALLLAWFWKDYTELPARLPGPRAVLLAIAAGVVVLALWLNLNAPWMVLGDAPGFDPRNDGAIDWALVLVRMAGAALVVPVMEELFWRSFLMRWISASDFETVDPSQIRLKSFLFTVVLFGIEHNLWLAGVVAGAAYSALYMRHRTLWSPILAHAVTNGLLGIWVLVTGNWSYW